MKWRLRRQETGRGEWSVFEPLRGYRICRYNHDDHGGTHIQHPETSDPLDLAEVDTPQQAESVMRRYHDAYDYFDLDKLRELITQWRSESVDD